MRTALRSLATTIVTGLVVVACTTAASPTPGSLPPSAPTAPSPMASSSPAATPPLRTPAPATPAPAVTPTRGRIAAGYLHTCALTDGGAVRCWGSNGAGQLGDGTAVDTTTPIDVVGLGSGVQAIAAGGFHACALTSGGAVRCWGSNEYGQLGDGTTTDRSVPVDVSGLTGGVKAISVGWSHTCAVTSVGGVKCWGHNLYGRLGDGTATDRPTPVDVAGLRDVSAIATGTLHTCALTSDGQVSCWGYGQSVDATGFTTHEPADVPDLGGRVVEIAASLDRTCARLAEGGITCWGPNFSAQAGAPAMERFVAIDVSRLTGGATALAVGETHACALTGRGDAACWGSDHHGQLGQGITSDHGVAVPVEVVGIGGGITGIATGGRHTCAIAGDDIRCWGSNDHGQLGVAMRCSSTSTPVRVALDGSAPPPSGADPSAAPTGRIAHATGPRDIVLRYDVGPDIGVSEIGGEQFNPGPEFTLYGNGAIIFRNAATSAPTIDGMIIRGVPFTITLLTEDQVQQLLRFAIGDGGLADACERYETQDTDAGPSPILTIRAGSLTKRIHVGSESPLGPLLSRLGAYRAASGVPTRPWVPGGYWGNLFEAAPAIEIGLLPDPRDVGTTPWPWPDISPADFAGHDEGGWIGDPRRVMSAEEASVLGLSDSGGVVQRTYLVGPDGATIYSFSMWPMSPDEQG